MAKKKTSEIKTAAIYARFSSHNQREESIEQAIDQEVTEDYLNTNSEESQEE